jgi:putative ABC transport system ATP-binding protein
MEVMLRGGADPAAARPPAELVRLVGVHKLYGRGVAGVHVLHDINLSVNPGEIVSICGPSGTGKTSLLHLAGMIEAPTEGNVIVTSLLTAKLSEQARAELRNDLIGFVFQTFSLIPVLTAQENVLLPLMLRGRLAPAALKAANALAHELLARVGLTTQAHHYPARLDDSQCQRVAIARSLITRPRLVIADEPTSRLEHGATRQVMDLFASEQREHGTAFLLSTRDQRQLSRVSRTLQLADGRLTAPNADARRKPLRVRP